MAGSRLLVRMVLTQLRLRFLLAMFGLLLVGSALGTNFLWEWHRHGDSYAMAYGSLLGFFAALITAAVTLTYLHVSRRSLAAAEAAIHLQREQWEARITVKPRFWLGIHPGEDGSSASRPVVFRRDIAETHQKSGGRHYYQTGHWPRLVLEIWNDGERSMRIGGYRLWVRDEESLHIHRSLAGFVLAPNEVKTVVLTEDLVAFSFRQRNFSERYERPPCEETAVGVRIYYSDWRQDDRSSGDEYYLVTCPAEAGGVQVERIGHGAKRSSHAPGQPGA